jgi:hypothetical protein
MNPITGDTNSFFAISNWNLLGVRLDGSGNLICDLSGLGKKSGIFLEYKNRQFGLRQLNCIQQILRWFGFYASTHLTSVAQGFREDLAASGRSGNDLLTQRIRTAWTKTYPNRPVPFDLQTNEIISHGKIIAFVPTGLGSWGVRES